MKGFAAFRDDTEVDFSGVELAALVGPTGSGKSTIIDGITFALFGAVARYDDNRAVAPAVNQLSTEARVELDFEVDGERHTAVRVVRRTPGGATTKEARLERGGEILAGRASEMSEAVEKALGLDFDRFTKTVVLPQGRFAQFLHDQPRDRQEVLRQLLDLDVYARMGAEARQQAATARDQREVLEPRLSTEVPGEEEVARLAAAAEAARQAQAELKDLVDGLASIGTDLTAARTKAATVERQHSAVSAVRVPEDARSLDAELKSAAEADRKAADELASARDRARQAEQDAAEGPNTETCRRLLADHERLTELREELSRLADAAVEAEQSSTEAKEQAERIKDGLEAAADETRAARRAADAAKVAAADGPDKAVLDRVRDQRAELDQLGGRLDELIEVRSNAETAEAEARAAHAQAKAALDETTDSLNRARAVKQAEGLADQLVEGEPCPVCRQTVLVLPDHDLDSEIEALKADQAEAAAALRDQEIALDEAKTTRATAGAATDSASRRRDELVDSLADAPDEAEADRQTARANELAAKANEANEKRDEALEAEEELRRSDTTKQILAAEEAANSTLIKVTTERDACQSHHNELADRLADTPDAAALEAELARAEELAADRHGAQAEEKAADEAAAAAREGLEQVRAEEDAARHEYGKVRDRLVALLVEQADVDAVRPEEGKVRDAVVATHQVAIEGDTARPDDGRARDGLAALEPPSPAASLLEDWETLAAWAATKASDLKEEKETVKSGVRALEARQAELTDQARRVCIPHFDPPSDPGGFIASMASAVTRAESAHQHAVDRRKEMADLEKQVEDLRAAEAVAAELGRLLRSDGFERWLMEEAVGDLKERASERLLELSNRQYSFAADGTDFDICDHHNADEVRGAKTLSGGETFLASLALALALTDGQAEMAPEGSPGLDSLFLDEGFGTLDPDTLDVVAAAIEELGATGRMVVIVTHIRDLAERIPVRFEVTKEPTTSSVERKEE